MAHMLWFLVLLSCSAPPIPDRRVPSDTLILRESFQGPGPERTGNWWGRFDVRGCWWEAHNTWMVVTDPLIQNATAHPAHWNAVEPDIPWFCHEDRERLRLEALVAQLPRLSFGESLSECSSQDSCERCYKPQTKKKKMLTQVHESSSLLSNCEFFSHSIVNCTFTWNGHPRFH